MKKILCDSMLCKNNTSQVPMMSGECMLQEINLCYCDKEEEALQCKEFKVSESKLELVHKYWDTHEDNGEV